MHQQELKYDSFFSPKYVYPRLGGGSFSCGFLTKADSMKQANRLSPVVTNDNSQSTTQSSFSHGSQVCSF